MKTNPDIEPSILLDQIINGKLNNIVKVADSLIESRKFLESKIGRVF